jgi:hypothetical protein
MIIPSILEKLSFVLANLWLWMSRRISTAQAMPSVTDLAWALPFIASFVKTRTSSGTQEFS